MPIKAYWKSIAYGNGIFLAAVSGKNYIGYSTNGINWVTKALPVSASWRALTFGGAEIINALTDEQAYNLLAKAQRHAATLPEPGWSQKEGHWAHATALGVVNGDSPEGLLKRCEMAAILGRKGML